MKKINFFITGLLLVILTSGATSQENKVPITTKSQDALQSYLKGRQLSEKLQGQNSIAFYQKAIELDPEFAMAHLNLALVQPSAKEFFASLNNALKSADRVSEGERFWILGLEAGVNGQAMKQREYYQKLVELYPGDERAHNLLGNHYFGFQEYDKAIEQYNKAIDINPDFSQPYNQMGYSYRFMGDYAKAEKAFKKYIELIPDDPNPYDSYAELLMKMGKYDESIGQYRKALQIDPQFVASHIGIACDLNYLEKHAEAREELQKLYDTARNDGERRAALFGMTISYMDERDVENAVKEMDKQYAIAGKNNDSAGMAGDLTAIGNIRFENGQYKEAMAAFEKSYQTMQNSNLKQEIKDNAQRFYYYNSARVALKENDIEKAKQNIKAFQEAVAKIKNPLQMQLVHELNGLLALQGNDYDKSIEELMQANLQNPYTFYRLATVYSLKGDKENARLYFEKAANHNTLNSLQYAFIRVRAKDKMSEL